MCLFPIGTHAVLAGCMEFLESRIYIKVVKVETNAMGPLEHLVLLID
jgi:hypothetical protein